jgi:N-acetylneuraminic acid mutarotase
MVLWLDGRTRIAMVMLLVSLWSGCGREAIPTNPSEHRPQLLISDAIHNGGNPHFYFLSLKQTPLPTFTSEFDPDQAPVVSICEYDLGCVAPVAEYTTVPTTGNEWVRVNPTEESYSVRWEVEDFGVDPAKLYRINVRVGSTLLGFADVKVVLSQKEARNVNTGEFIPLTLNPQGRAGLRIAFRIEVGALPPPPAFWESLPSMPTARQWVAAVSVEDRLYAVGGWNGSNLASTEMFDQATGQWTALAPTPEPRYAGTGLQHIDGRLYLAGGALGYPVFSGSLFIYDIASDSWSSGPPAPSPVGCGGSGVVAGQLYVFSGCSTSFAYEGDLFRFDPATGNWVTLPEAPTLHVYPAVAATGTKLYVIGGVNDVSNTVTGTVHTFDAETGQWSVGPDLPTPRYSSVALAQGGKLYVIGGRTSTSGPGTGLVEVLDLSSGTWSNVSSMPTPRWDAGAALLGTRIAVVGGAGNSFVETAVFEALNP